MEISIVVPCYNEGGRWNDDYWHDLVSFAGIRWVFVNDGSTDDTATHLQRLGGRSAATILNAPVNAGKAEAVRLGMRKVLSSPQGNIFGVGFMDADGAFSPEAIREVVDAFAQRTSTDNLIDAVWSSRVALAGRSIHRSAPRHYVGRVIATYLSAGQPSLPYDTQCGLKLFVPSDDLRRCLAEPFQTRWLFDCELLVRWQGQVGAPMRIWEEPLISWQEIAGSRINLRESIRILKELQLVKRQQRKCIRSLSPNPTASENWTRNGP